MKKHVVTVMLALLSLAFIPGVQAEAQVEEKAAGCLDEIEGNPTWSVGATTTYVNDMYTGEYSIEDYVERTLDYPGELIGPVTRYVACITST